MKKFVLSFDLMNNIDIEELYKSDHAKQRQVTWKTNSNGCFICTSHKTDDNGYAVGQRRGRHVKLHRYFYELAYGTLRKDQVLLHSCDTRNCINIMHLTPGSHQENMADMVAKGRSARGERVGSSKLSKRKVKVIRNSKLTSRELADKYEVSVSTINRVKKGVYWKYD